VVDGVFLGFFGSILIGLIITVILAVYRHRRLKLVLGNLINHYNSNLFQQRGLYLHWTPVHVPILKIQDIAQPIMVQTPLETPLMETPLYQTYPMKSYMPVSQ